MLNHYPMGCTKGMRERPHCGSTPRRHELFPCTDERLHPINSGLLLQSGTYEIQKLTVAIHKDDIIWILDLKLTRKYI